MLGRRSPDRGGARAALPRRIRERPAWGAHVRCSMYSRFGASRPASCSAASAGGGGWGGGQSRAPRERGRAAREYNMFHRLPSSRSGRSGAFLLSTQLFPHQATARLGMFPARGRPGRIARLCVPRGQVGLFPALRSVGGAIGKNVERGVQHEGPLLTDSLLRALLTPHQPPNK